jgi:glycosyltransferase involved in cell wall biosynthesis
MKVYVFPADEHGCGHYRLIWPAQVLASQGNNVVLVGPKDRDQALQARMDGNIVKSVRIPSDADVIVFQRITHKFLAQAITHIRREGVAVVVDMDDDLTCIHPSNPAFHALHPIDGPNALHSWQNTLTACDNATLVTTSTDALIDRYARRRPGRVLRNAVPARYLQIAHGDSDVMGWAGSVHSHPTDLQVMGPAIAQLLQTGYKFKIAGSLHGVHAALGVSQKLEIESTGDIKFEAWPLAVNSIGIGVAPLATSKFNESKSWLKPLEYAAVGVPCVLTPSSEYKRAAKLGIGIVAKKPDEWRRQLRLLLTNESLRRDLSERGREAAAKQTIEENAWRWWEAWIHAYEIEQTTAVGVARAA